MSNTSELLDTIDKLMDDKKELLICMNTVFALAAITRRDDITDAINNTLHKLHNPKLNLGQSFEKLKQTM